MRERLCLEIERLGVSAVIMGSRGFGAEKRGSDGKLGSVSDYCVHHCVCPVVVVRFPDDRDACPAPGGTKDAIVTVKSGRDDDEEDEAKIAADSAHHEHIKAITTGTIDFITSSGLITPIDATPTPLFAVPYAAPIPDCNIKQQRTINISSDIDSPPNIEIRRICIVKN
uniref:UspA domain-containing protein n=1 Tax=Brassica campestris TaxID=3711 RepID=M4D1Q7_BRACM